jgi:hypothetical protein
MTISEIKNLKIQLNKLPHFQNKSNTLFEKLKYILAGVIALHKVSRRDEQLPL